MNHFTLPPTGKGWSGAVVPPPLPKKNLLTRKKNEQPLERIELSISGLGNQRLDH